MVNGFIDVYNKWVDIGVDGFRIDTVKHVDIQFWQKFSPAVIAHAKAIGNKDFFMFGEVYDSNPAYMSTFTTTGALQATLDFGFQSNALSYAQGKTAKNLADFYAADDYYTDANSNAYQLPTFTGNHDMGRVAMQLKASSTSDADLLARVKLTNSLMYLTRGNPVVYYGDEQGFIGAGGDKDAREDMFATQTASYATEAVLGRVVGREGQVRHGQHPVPADRLAGAAPGAEPGAGRRCAADAVRRGRRGHLRVLAHRLGASPGPRVRGRGEQLERGVDGDVHRRHVQRDAAAAARCDALDPYDA